MRFVGGAGSFLSAVAQGAKAEDPARRFAAIVAIAVGGVGVLAYQPAPAALTSIEVMIPMRDGTRLFTQIYRPRLRSASAPGSFGGTGSPGAAGPATEPLPIVFQRTPYGVGQNTPAGVATALIDLPADGYLIVLQDIRGRFKSEGEFVMLRQPRPSMNSGRPELVEGRDRKDAKALDESTDTYDT